MESTVLTWSQEKGVSKTYALMDSDQREMAHIKISPMASSYILTYNNSRILFKPVGIGTKIIISDDVLGRELGTISCSYRLFFFIPNMVEWKDGRVLYAPPPSVIQLANPARYIYSLALIDEKGRRLMRMEWLPSKRIGPLRDLSSSKERERCSVFPEELPLNDHDFCLFSAIGWIKIIQSIWMDDRLG